MCASVCFVVFVFIKEWVLFAIRLYYLLLLSIPHQKQPFFGTHSTPKWLILEHFWPAFRMDFFKTFLYMTQIVLSAGQKPFSGSYKRAENHVHFSIWLSSCCTLLSDINVLELIHTTQMCINERPECRGMEHYVPNGKKVCAQFSLCVLISEQWCLSWEIIINKIIINKWVTILVFLWSKSRSSSVSCFKSSAIYFFTSGTDWKWVPLSVEPDPAPSTKLQLQNTETGNGKRNLSNSFSGI